MSNSMITGLTATAAAVAATSSATSSTMSFNAVCTPTMPSTILATLPSASESCARAAWALNSTATTGRRIVRAGKLLASTASAAAASATVVPRPGLARSLPLSKVAKTLTRFFFAETALPPFLKDYGALLTMIAAGAGTAAYAFFREQKNSRERIQEAMFRLAQLRVQWDVADWESQLVDCPEYILGLYDEEVRKMVTSFLTRAEGRKLMAEMKRKVDAEFVIASLVWNKRRKANKENVGPEEARKYEEDGRKAEAGSRALSEAPSPHSSPVLSPASSPTPAHILSGPKLTPGPSRQSGKRHENIEWRTDKEEGDFTPGRNTMPRYPYRGPFTPGSPRRLTDSSAAPSRNQHDHSPSASSPLGRTPQVMSSGSTPASSEGGTPPGSPPHQSLSDGAQDSPRTSPLPRTSPSSPKGGDDDSSSDDGDDREMPRGPPPTRPSAPTPSRGLGLQQDDTDMYPWSSSSHGSPASRDSELLSFAELTSRAFDPNALGNRPYESPVLGSKRKRPGQDDSGRQSKRGRLDEDWPVSMEGENNNGRFSTIFEGASPQVDPPAGTSQYRVSESKTFWKGILAQRNERRLQSRIFPPQQAQEVEDGDQAMVEESLSGSSSPDVDTLLTTSDQIAAAEAILDAELEAIDGMQEEEALGKLG